MNHRLALFSFCFAVMLMGCRNNLQVIHDKTDNLTTAGDAKSYDMYSTHENRFGVYVSNPEVRFRIHATTGLFNPPAWAGVRYVVWGWTKEDHKRQMIGDVVSSTPNPLTGPLKFDTVDLPTDHSQTILLDLRANRIYETNEKYPMELEVTGVDPRGSQTTFSGHYFLVPLP